MPEPLGIYLMALLHFTNPTSCSAIADAFDRVSHDRLTRMLQGTWSGHILLDLALRALGSVLDVEMATLDQQSKSISVDKQAYDNVVHLRGFREADRLAD